MILRSARNLFVTLAVALPVFAAEESPVDQISQAAIQSAFQVLQRDYIRREDLTFDQLNRAALQGLLQRLAFGAEIVKDPAPGAKSESRVLGESLSQSIAYLRPVAFSEKEVSMLEAAVKQLVGKGATSVLLDMRSAAQPGEFETAAAMLELFLPRGQLLFKLKQLGARDAQLFVSKREPVWNGPLVVLADGDSCNVAETIAASLHHHRRAIVVGTTTRGATVRYQTAPLDNGWHLRFASAEMLLPDDASVFRRGVTPDFSVALDAATKRNIFTLSAAGTIKTFVMEQARPRFNEAALVAGKNPDFDEFIRRSSGELSAYDQPPARDKVIQRALDLIMGSDHLMKSRLQWSKPQAPAEQIGPSYPKAEPAKP